MVAFICMLVGAVLNRFSGWTNVPGLPGRNIYWAALVLFILATATVGLAWGVTLLIAALCYRLPGWFGAIDIGKNEGEVIADARVMFYRTMWFFAPILFYILPWHWNFFGLVVAPLVSIACVMVYYLGNHYLYKFTKDPFRYVEPIVGGLLGLGVATLL